MLLEALVNEHLKQHDDDAEKSLAAVSSFGSLREELSRLADPNIEASLAHVSVARAADPHATQRWTAGEATSAGARFRILRPHARGGLGEVYVARDEELHREVALKEIQERHAHDADSRARFLLEAEITGGLEHPGIVPVYGLGTYADGRPFYAMRFIKGDSLKEAIQRFHGTNAAGESTVALTLRVRKADGKDGDRHQRGGKGAFASLEFRKLLGRFIDVCNAIEYAHSRGVLHRDLKPGNIMLGKYGETLVVDWGLAKVIGRPEARAPVEELTLKPSSSSVSAATQMGSAIGTPQYMSPEQAEGRLDQLGPASDVYSLGATLYTILTGRPAFPSDELGTMLGRVAKGDFPSPRATNPAVPRALEAICLKAMSASPGDRYGSPRALSDDIEHWLADEPIVARRDTRVDRAARWMRRHRAWMGSAVAASTLVAIATIVAALGIDSARRGTKIAWANAKEAANRANEQARAARIAEQAAKSEADRADRAAESAKRAEVKATTEARRAAEALAEGVLSARPEGVQAALASLRPVAHLVSKRLLDQLDDRHGDAVRRLRAACALAQLGESTQRHLLAAIPNAPASECDNIANALGHLGPPAIEELLAVFASTDPLANRLRYAVVALHVGQTRPAEDLLAVRADPINRTTFIHAYGTLRGEMSRVAMQLHQCKNEEFRSGVCAAIGRIAAETMGEIERERVAKTLLDLYLDAPDGGTHSAAAWALRQFGEPLPVLESARPDLRQGRRWFVNGQGMTMIQVPPRSFRMGRASGGLPFERPDHDVTITKGYWLSDKEVTVAQYRRFIDDPDFPQSEKPAEWGNEVDRIESYSPTPDCPATFVSWSDAVLFCNWLSILEGLAPCYERTGMTYVMLDHHQRAHECDIWKWNDEADGYRLPAEAEWENACRAGSATSFCFGSGEGDDLALQYGWFAENAKGRTMPTGTRMPNAWGFFDMHGNVMEHCWDWYSDYIDGNFTDPIGPPSGSVHILRGGSVTLLFPLGNCTVRMNQHQPPTRYLYMHGFRVARTVFGSTKQASPIPRAQ